jgi:hypothetical protein
MPAGCSRPSSNWPIDGKTGVGARVTGKDGTVYASTLMGGTDVFRKIGTDWKVIYIQESGPPPIPVAASR